MVDPYSIAILPNRGCDRRVHCNVFAAKRLAGRIKNCKVALECLGEDNSWRPARAKLGRLANCIDRRVHSGKDMSRKLVRLITLEHLKIQ